MEQFLEEVLNSIIYQWQGWGEELGAKYSYLFIDAGKMMDFLSNNFYFLG